MDVYDVTNLIKKMMQFIDISEVQREISSDIKCPTIF